ncbi:MAG: phosphatase [Lachnospiraceae bacterium]|nr:phosphatase [Lachnospiraceae bacterium]
MKYVMDLHTHTIASGHAYSTLQENIARAQEMGLKVLGLSEHGPNILGGPHIMFFWNLKIVPRQYGDLRLLCGAEANIMDIDGTLDLDDFTLSRLDYCIASMHTPCLKQGNAEENTLAAINTMKNPYVTILGHPDDSRYPLDYDRLVQAAVEHKVVLEVNNSSLHPLSARQGARENILTLLRTCKKYNCPIILGSDSHISYDIGEFVQAESLLKEVDFPESLIVNTSVEKLEKILIRKEK